MKANALERMILAVSPGWAAKRAKARVIARHYEAATPARRTTAWRRTSGDANAAAIGSLSRLRDTSRDLVRNSAWAQNAVRVIPRSVVGWGITPKPVGGTKKLAQTVKAWMESTACDAAGRLSFAGLLSLISRGTVESGEMLIRRRWRRPEDGLTIPMQYQVLEPDFIDTSRHAFRGTQGGPVLHGIEYDAIGRRVAYWLFEEHPGSSYSAAKSHRVPASEIIHVFNVERAGQERGVPWLCAAILAVKDFDEFEDAQILRQKIAAMFAAFVTDYEGDGAASLPGTGTGTDAAALGGEEGSNDLVLVPGTVQDLPPGKQITTANPPTVTEDGFSTRALRKIAAAIGITYEDLSGDYSQVNFSSARMGRIGFWQNVHHWQWNMLIPQACTPMWGWAMEAAALVGLSRASAPVGVEWSPQPMPLIEPDREAKANLLMIRSGQKTLSQVLRENGMDPETHLAEYAADLAKLDELGIRLDSDVRRVSQAGLAQVKPSEAKPAGTLNGTGEPADEDEDEDEDEEHHTEQ